MVLWLRGTGTHDAALVNLSVWDNLATLTGKLIQREIGVYSHVCLHSMITYTEKSFIGS